MPSRRDVFTAAFALGTAAALDRTSLVAAAVEYGAEAPDVPGVRWHNARDLGIEGQGWTDTLRRFDRLPRHAEGAVPPRVWDLSRQSAGITARFRTDATALHVRHKLLLPRLAMPHMPATGVSGVDLYARDDTRPGRPWRWAAVTKPTTQQGQQRVLTGLGPAVRDWTAYFPLYNGVESLEIGVPEDATLEPIPPRTAKPVVFYGTSILHGASASRPGMAWPAIVGRRIDRPTVNLGFSGSGKMEPELATLLAEIDAAAYVIDCAPNMTPAMIEERAHTFVTKLREARPGTPIVLVEDRVYGYSWLRPSSRDRNTGNADALARTHEALVERGMKMLHHVKARALLGDDPGELLTDGSHPSDLGMSAYADALTPVIRRALAHTPG